MGTQDHDGNALEHQDGAHGGAWVNVTRPMSAAEVTEAAADGGSDPSADATPATTVPDSSAVAPEVGDAGGPEQDTLAGQTRRLGKHDVASVSVDATAYVQDVAPSPYLSESESKKDFRAERDRRGKVIGIVLVVLLVLGVGVGAWAVVTRFLGDGETSGVQYETATVEEGEFVDVVSGSAFLAPANTSLAYPSTSGTIDTVSVADGDQVEQGQVIATLTNPTIEQAATDAKDALDEAKDDVEDQEDDVQDALDDMVAELNGLVAIQHSIYSIMGVKSDGSDLTIDTDGDGTNDAIDTDGDGVADLYDTTGDGIPDAIDTDGDGVADAPDLTANGTSDVSVAEDGTVTIDVDSFIAGLDTDSLSTTKKQQVTALTKTLTSQADDLADAVEDYNTERSRLTELQATQAEAQSAYDTAQANLDLLNVYAPISGTVADVTESLAVGQSVDTTTTLLRVNDLTQLTASVSLDAEHFQKVSAGQTATVTFDDVSDLTVTAQVTDVVASDSGDGSGVATVLITEPDERLAMDMRCSVEIEVNRIESTLMVPIEAIRTDSDGQTYVDVLLDSARGIESEAIVTVTATSDTTAAIEASQVPANTSIVLSRTGSDDQ